MELSVYEFCQMCCEPRMLVVSIFDLESSEEVYKGVLDDMPLKYQNAIVETFDLPTHENEMCLNVCL